MGTLQNTLMTAEEKKRDLYLRQKQLLDTFLEHGAISRAQYDKSLGDLTVKMGMEPMAWSEGVRFTGEIRSFDISIRSTLHGNFGLMLFGAIRHLHTTNRTERNSLKSEKATTGCLRGSERQAMIQMKTNRGRFHHGNVRYPERTERKV